jgi:DNA-binding SARP family transcriptional activator
MGTLHLALFGGFKADIDGLPLDDLPTRKARALLAILATSPDRRQPREIIAAMLWERSAEEQARASLRQTLASVRKVLAEANADGVLEADSESVWLHPERCEIDAAKFEAFLEQDGPDAAEAMCRLYSGDFLAGLNLREASFEQWLVVERRRFQELARRALSRLFTRCLEAGDYARAMDCGTRLLAMDPLQEDVHRGLMDIHAREGHRGLALRQFETCRDLLKRELGVEPESDTVKLADTIRRQAHVSETQQETLSSSAAADAPDSDVTTPSEVATKASSTQQSATFPGEIRPVTVLFARFALGVDDLDPPDAEQHHRLAQTFQESTEESVIRYGGHVENRIGDTVVAIYGIPAAHGNDAERALRAAVEIRALTPSLGEEAAQPVAAQVGVASGQVVVSAGDAGQGSYNITGDSVDVARQLEVLSWPGEVLATQAVVADAERFFDFQAAPEINVRSRGRALPVYRVSTLRETPRWLHPTRFVGRQFELEQMQNVLGSCRDAGHAHIVFVRGEPGIGKTRLLEETAKLAEQRAFACYRVLVLDFGTRKGEEVPRALARGLLQLSSGAEEERRQEAAERAVKEGRTRVEMRVFLNDLLDLPQPLELRSRFDAMDERIRNQGKTEVLTDLISSRCARVPVLLMIEDLHWADPFVIEQLADLSNSLAAQRLVVLMTSRIEGDPLDSKWRTATREVPLLTIDLRPLRVVDAVSLAEEICTGSDDFRKRCVERAQGNPLFLEQLLRVGEEDDTGEAIPSNVQELTLSRCDRLDSKDRNAVRAASVLGQRFDIEALRHLVQDPHYECTELVAHDLVHPHRGYYLFAHALIRDGIHASLLSDSRQALHMRAADWFAQTDLVLRANHLEAAGHASAPVAYADAARAEFRAYRVERALQLVARGLEIAADTDRFHLYCLRGEFLHHVGPIEESLRAYQSALGSTAEETDRCRALVGIAMGLRVLDKHDEAVDVLDEAEPIAEAHELWEDLAKIYITRANLAFWKGQTGNCLPFNQRALEYARKAKSIELEVHALGGLGDAYYAGGRMRSAHDYLVQCVEAARRNGLGRVEVAHNQMIGGGTLQYSLDLRRSLALCLETAETSAQVGSLRSELQSYISATNAAIFLGKLSEARTYAELAKRLAERLGAKRTIARYFCYLGRINLAEGERRKACEVLEEGLKVSRNTGPGYCGAAILGTLARATDESKRRHAALSEGESMLESGAVGHNFLEFYEDAIEACLESRDWDEAERYARLLEDYVDPEPLALTDFIVARGRALIAFGKGERNNALTAELNRLAGAAKEHGLALALPAIEKALAEVGA